MDDYRKQKKEEQIKNEIKFKFDVNERNHYSKALLRLEPEINKNKKPTSIDFFFK